MHGVAPWESDVKKCHQNKSSNMPPDAEMHLGECRDSPTVLYCICSAPHEGTGHDKKHHQFLCLLHKSQQ